jgi:predicted nucleotidyltransferase
MDEKVKIAIDVLNEEIKNIYCIYLFGSFSTKYQRGDSDLDLAILSEDDLSIEKTWEIAQKVASKIKIDVDLVDLKKASTVFQNQIINEGKKIYIKDQTKVDFFENYVDSMYLDLNERRRDLIEDIKERRKVF